MLKSSDSDTPKHHGGLDTIHLKPLYSLCLAVASICVLTIKHPVATSYTIMGFIEVIHARNVGLK